MDGKTVFQILLVAAIGAIIWLIGKALVQGRTSGGWRPVSRNEDPSLFYRMVLTVGFATLVPLGMAVMIHSGTNDEAPFRWGFFLFFLGLTGVYWTVLSIAVTHGVIANLLTRRLRDVAVRDRQPWSYWPSKALAVAGALFCTYITTAALLKATA